MSPLALLRRPRMSAVLPEDRRNLAFGLFYAGYGSGWLVGRIVMGLLYQQSRVALVAFAAQLASVPLFIRAKHAQRASR
jgi:hypothetical protein